MTDEQLKLIIQNALINEDCFKLVEYIIGLTGALDNSLCFEPNKDYFTQGKKSVGYILLNRIFEHDTKSYIKLIGKD